MKLSPLEARILGIADDFSAMTTERPYRPAMSHKEAIEELKRNAGTQFDPGLTHAFIKIIESSIPEKGIAEKPAKLE